MSAATHYLLCTTPRSGSSPLCHLLAKTDIAGMKPRTVFGAEYLLEVVEPIPPVASRAPKDLAEYLRDAFRRSAGTNGVGGFKVMWDQIPRLMKETCRRNPELRLEAADFRRFLPDGTRFVWLLREDTIAQAVSLARALQTQAWSSVSEARFSGPLFFDYLGIARARSRIERDQQRWRSFFGAHGIEPLVVTYEQFAADRANTVRRILGFLDLDADVPIADDSPLHPQRDQRSHQWEERFRVLERSGRLRKAIQAFDVYPRSLLATILTTMRSRRRRRALAASAPAEREC